MRPIRLGIAAVLFLAPAVLVHSQSPQQPTFRSALNVVPLSATVVDRQGRPVTGLSAADFTVVEDGRPREILSFSSELLVEGGGSRVGSEIAPKPETGLQPDTRRVFLIVLGYGRIQYPTRAVDGARDFVLNRLMSQDLVAVMAFNRTTDFTTDHAAVVRFLERFKRESEQLEFVINQYWVHNRNDQLSEQLQSAIDNLFLGPIVGGDGSARRHDGSRRNAVPLLFGTSTLADESTTPPTPPAPLTVDLNPKPPPFHARATLGDLMVRSGLLKLYAGIEYLRHRPGRKYLVFLGPPLPIQDKENEDRLAQRANHAQVTLHYIGTLGVPANSPTAAAAMAALAALGGVQGLQNLTSQTGGAYTGLRVANDALAEIDRASRSYYLIGYQPVSAEDDGRYRRVEVRVARRDVLVRFRTGYYATGDSYAPPLPELLAQSRIESASNFDIEVKDVGVTGKATFVRPSATKDAAGDVRVEISVDASKVGIVSEGGLRSARFAVTLFGMDSRDGVVGGGSGKAVVEVDDALLQAYQKNGIPLSFTFPVMERPRDVRIIVYSFGSDLMGTARAPVR